MGMLESNGTLPPRADNPQSSVAQDLLRMGGMEAKCLQFLCKENTISFPLRGNIQHGSPVLTRHGFNYIETSFRVISRGGIISTSKCILNVIDEFTALPRPTSWTEGKGRVEKRKGREDG